LDNFIIIFRIFLLQKRIMLLWRTWP